MKQKIINCFYDEDEYISNKIFINLEYYGIITLGFMMLFMSLL